MTNEIKCCPFCGSQDIQTSTALDVTIAHKHFMKCVACGARGPTMQYIQYRDDEEKKQICIKLWNKR